MEIPFSMKLLGRYCIPMVIKWRLIFHMFLEIKLRDIANEFSDF